ncbi:MAG: hypothetical protein AB1Z98_35070 [Nannocystaceae bacterium]
MHFGSTAAGLGAALLLGLTSACAASATSTQPPGATDDRIAWIDAPLLGSPPREVDALDQLGAGDLQDRRVRLDRLLDLFDAARFGQDEDARETLWGALGGHATGVGDDATREATELMLREALALEEGARRAADDAAASFAADVIMMLSTDLQPPGSADDLSIRTLVYRTLVEQGHPRVADNARWRLYDHARGTLEGAIQVAPEHRMEVAVQALYAERDSVEDLLADTAPHAQPPWPTADGLWTLVQTQHDALRQAPRWAGVVEHRERQDHELHDTLRTVLPAPRRNDWPLTTLPTGTARAESLAPVLWIHDGRLMVDAGRGHARTVAMDADIVELSQAVGNALAQDGRGTALLVAEPALPSPVLRTALRALARAQVERLELAVREPRIDAEAGEVVMALPLYATRRGGERMGDRAWEQARVHVHLEGRGPRLAVDGRWLEQVPAAPAGLRALVEQVAAAYPRERGVGISLGPDVQLQQLIELLVALQGGPQRPFNAVGWFTDGWHPPEGDSGAEALLARRSAMAWRTPVVDIAQPYPLAGRDQERLEGFAAELAVCLPELGLDRAPPAVAVTLKFEEGRLRSSEIATGKRLPKAGAAAGRECVEEEGYALRLREHREGLTITVTLRPG